MLKKQPRRKQSRLSVLVTAQQVNRWERVAKAQGRLLSSWVRVTLDSAAALAEKGQNA